MKTLLLILSFVAYAVTCNAQSWSNILSSGRAINWTSAGLPATFPDGETTTNPWTPPTRTQCTAYSGYPSAITGTGTASTDAPALNNALAACSQGSGRNGVYIPITGTFNLGGSASGATSCYGGSAYYCLEFYAVNAVTLRGAGPMSAQIDLTGNGTIVFGAAFGSGSCTWSSGFSAGATSITATSCSGTPGANWVVNLEQCDSGYNTSPACSTGSSTDNGGLYVCGLNLACAREGTSYQPSQEQNVLVSSTSGTCSSSCTVNFTPGLYLPNWATGNSPFISWQVSSTGATPYGDGLEDVTIYASSNTQNYATEIDNTYASWIKGVRFVGSGTSAPLYIVGDKNCLIFNDYFFSDPAIDSIFPDAMEEGGDSDDLVLNNIETSGDPWEGTGSMEGDIDGYNYSRDNFTAYVLDTFEHNAGDAFLLYEGNQTPSIQEDDTHGTHDLGTLFRNQLPGWNAPYVSSNFAATDIDAFARFFNFVGNVMGSGQLSLYQATCTGCGASPGADYIYDLGDANSAHTDALVFQSSLRWANYDTITGAVRYCGNSSSPGWSSTCSSTSEIPTTLTGNAAFGNNLIPSSTTLPCSFFLAGYTSTSCSAHPSGGTGLSWWKVCTAWSSFPTSCGATTVSPFPVAGPDVSGGPNISGYAYNTPAELAWATLPIDTSFQNSYSITGSNWTGGVETLTVSGFTSSTHMMGPFQILGGNCATTGAGTSTGAEVYITGPSAGSSTTQVTYALASNPGTCTGTMLFPDIREFDERVYQADSGGSSGAGAAASGITFKGVTIQ